MIGGTPAVVFGPGVTSVSCIRTMGILSSVKRMIDGTLPQRVCYTRRCIHMR